MGGREGERKERTMNSIDKEGKEGGREEIDQRTRNSTGYKMQPVILLILPKVWPL